MSGSAFKKFKRRAHAELRPYEKDENLKGVSISAADRNAGSPRSGDMIARNPDDHSDQWLVARKFFLKNYISESDSSGYVDFARPDPMDPNDRKRQQTQARSADYPYDMPTSYGRPVGTDMDGAAYQMTPTTTPPCPKSRKASDWRPKDPWNLANEMAEGTLDTYEPGPQAPDAVRLGYGNHGRMGDGIDPQELNMDALRSDFRDSFIASLPVVQSMGRRDLFALLAELDPEYSAELFAPDDDGMVGVYNDWGRHVYAPDAEQDPEQLL